MTLCPPSCHIAVPTNQANCTKVTKPGGILHLLIFACDAAFDATIDIDGTPTAIGPITDVEAWKTLVANRFIGISPEGYGEHPISEKTSEELTACVNNGVTGEDHVINFISKFMNKVTDAEFDFWTDVKANHGRYRLGWMDCDNTVYVKSTTGQPGFVFTLPGNADLVTPNNNREATRFEFSPSFRHDPNSGLIRPLQIVDIEEIFAVEVNS